MREFSEKPLEAVKTRCEEGLDENLRMKKSKKSKSKNFCLFFFPRVVESSSFIISTLWLVSFITDARARLRERERERERAQRRKRQL